MASVETMMSSGSPTVGARPTQGSRPSSRVGFIVEARPHSRQGSQGSNTSDGFHPRPPSSPRRSDRGSPSERPPSVKLLRSKTEMSEHFSPIVKSAVRRWKRFHENRVLERFKVRKLAKNEHIKTVKEEKLRLARKIPIDVLALEWMNTHEVTVETRAFLLDKLLPTLILGVEKLLTEVEKRGLAETIEPNPNFNPINYLAQYLMRNNPRYSNFPEASPYIRGLKDVTDELKEHVFSFEDNRLARAKAEARRQREEQEKVIQQKQIEKRLRSANIKDNFKEWLRNSEGKLMLRLLQSSLYSFIESFQEISDEEATKFTMDIKPVEDPEKTVTAEEFAEFVKGYANDMPAEIFGKFMKHMSQCANAFCKSNEKEHHRSLLTDLFRKCDHTDLGILDRHRVLALLAAFWDNAAWPIRRVLRNPRKWPVIEIDEMEDDVESVTTEGSLPGSLSNVEGRVLSVSGKEIPNQTHDAEEDKMEESKPPETDSLEQHSEIETGEKTKIKEDEKEVNQEEAKPDESHDQMSEEPAKEDKGEKESPVEENGELKEAKPDKSHDQMSEEPAKEDKGEKESPVEENGELKEAKPDESRDQMSEEPAKEDKGEKESPVEESSELKEAKPDESRDQMSEEPAKEDKGEKESPVEENGELKEAKPDESRDQMSEEPAKEDKGEKESPVEECGELKEAKPDESRDQMSEEPAKEDKGEKESPVEKSGELKEDTPEAKTPTGNEETKQADEKNITPEPSKEIEESKGDENTQVKATASQQQDESQQVDESEEGEVSKDRTVDDKQETVTAEGSALFKEPHPPTATSIGQASVSFREDVASPKNQPYPRSDGRSVSVTTSAFDESTLNPSQFAQLILVFLGDDLPDGTIKELITYIREGYIETEEEKFKRMQQARKQVQTAKRRQMMNQLFDRWDNDGSGYLDLEELLIVLAKFKENMESKVVKKALKTLNKEEGDLRLNKAEFQAYIKAVCDHLPGGDDNFDPLIEFLMTSVERSYEERIRGQARKKWLAQIVQSAQTSGASLDPVFKAVFNALYKDAEQHGRGKRISANVALLEHNDMAPHRGPTLLRYVAATPDDAHFMLGKLLYRDMRGISFSSVDTGKPLHVPRVQNHGNIMFFNNDRTEEDRQGSFIVIPLKDQMRRVFGTLGIDTLNDPQEKSIFITHEISFFQGVSKAFSTAYHYIDIRRKTLRIAESAISWIHRRSPHVMQVDVFIVEPDEKLEDFVLRKMLTTDRHGNTTTHDNPQKLERKENLFRDYLYKCIDNSETIAADAYGVRHTAFPLRDPDGRAVAIVDISIGELRELPNHENKEVQRMLKLLQTAHKEVSQESAGGDKTIVLEAEKDSEQNRIDIMFDRIMLMDLRENVGKLNARAFAELKSYKEPPKVIHDIVLSVLTLFFQEKSESGELEQWNNCKQLISSDLINKIGEFDPTASDAVNSVQKIAGTLKDVPHGAVAKHGSLPAQHLYNWAFVCLSLLEHSKKMNDKRPGVTQAIAATPQSDVITEAS
ncbi:EF-hand calcium-binding domain-containing protein 5-like isoform X2 [Antedon mediterranea]|uniref:EF-hand calcium-binding domain-containing protein 5-like isoform X2 n=1 Tax=Antedon mediterranea TaxID=105859 RepID=UPI003AF4ED27